MKYLKITLVVFLFFSCNEKKESNNEFNLIGNWYSFFDNSYQEYYFDGESMNVYDPYSGNVLEYKYTVKNDSILRYFVHDNQTESNYEYFNTVLEADSLQVRLKEKNLKKIETENTLEDFLNRKIDSKAYYNFCMERMGNVPN